MNITRNAAILAAASAAALFALVPTSALAQSSYPTRSPVEIDQIVGPIALYPDPLVSVVLPAATMPDEVQAAAQVVANGDNASIDNPSWDDSVRAVAHYPDLVLWMNDNIDWTAQLGATFTAQPADVLNSVQRLRARAYAVGTLVDTPQQRVVIEGNLIAIVPAEPTIIYVPRYDPALVYIDHPPRRGAAVFGFSVGFATGAWLTYDFDWRRHSLFVADRSWAARRDWSRPSFSIAVNARDTRREWRPAPNRAQANISINISRTVVTPRAMTERTTFNAESRTGANRFDRTAQPTRNPSNFSSNQPVPPSQNPSAAISAPATPPQPNQPAPNTAPARTANTEERRAAEARNEQLARDRERERQRALESNRAAISQNPERPNVAPQPAAPTQNTPPPPRVTTQPPAGALTASEQQRREQLARDEAERRANEARRPVPRGAVTAGSTGEYPPAAVKENERNRSANPPNPSDERSQRPANPPGLERAQQKASPNAKVPASAPPTVQPQPDSEEEKARKQKEEEEKKKKQKPNDSGGA